MKKFFETVKKYNMINKGDHIIVGVSGGADSLCLLFLLMELQKEVPFQITVVHVEHGIRGEESMEDARYVEEICKENQVEFHMERVDIRQMAAKEHLTVEEAGRKVRYDTFKRVLAEQGANKIAVAHNRNDQAETMLWNMARGSGMNGAAGIRPVRGNIIRPLLECDRKEIEGYLKSRNIIWREDRTNQEMDYTRNVIRGQVFPLLKEKVNARSLEHFASLGEEMRRTEEYLDKLVNEKLKDILQLNSQGGVLFIEELCREDDFLQERMIRQALKIAGCPLKDLTRAHINQICSLLQGQSGRQTMLPGGWTVRREFEKLYMEKRNLSYSVTEGNVEEKRAKIRIFPNKNQIIPRKKYTKWFSYDKISCDFQIRTRQPGDYLIINQLGQKKKLKEYLVEEKVPLSIRNQIPLVARGHEIIWVVGYRISENYKITEETKEIIEIQFEEEESWLRK
ncbi:MAG: tRNA lysidine(34) synthetase TilS [Muricoprocola sp.]